MCGIFGYFCRSYVNMQKVLKLLRILETHQYKSEKHPVGGHGAGVCFLNDSGELTVYKIGKEGKISPVIPHLFEEKLRKYHDEIEARKKTLENIEGNNAIAILSATKNDRVFLHILHKGQSRGMHIWKNDHGEIIFCSRPKPLQQIFRTFLKKNNFKKILSISYQEPKETQQTYRIVFL